MEGPAIGNNAIACIASTAGVGPDPPPPGGGVGDHEVKDAPPRLDKQVTE
jgi:hypothetical protein